MCCAKPMPYEGDIIFFPLKFYTLVPNSLRKISQQIESESSKVGKNAETKLRYVCRLCADCVLSDDFRLCFHLYVVGPYENKYQKIYDSFLL